MVREPNELVTDKAAAGVDEQSSIAAKGKQKVGVPSSTIALAEPSSMRSRLRIKPLTLIPAGDILGRGKLFFRLANLLQKSREWWCTSIFLRW